MVRTGGGRGGIALDKTTATLRRKLLEADQLRGRPKAQNCISAMPCVEAGLHDHTRLCSRPQSHDGLQQGHPARRDHVASQTNASDALVAKPSVQRHAAR